MLTLNPGHVFHLAPVPRADCSIILSKGILRVCMLHYIIKETLDIYNIKIKLEGFGKTGIAQCHSQECYERGMLGA